MSNHQKNIFKGGGKLNTREEDITQKKGRRGKRFSQKETDLLLSLVMSSNVNSMETNSMTAKGRSMGWESICASFNASPGVMQRTEKELRERTGNIRKDMYKLSRFQKESVQATGGGHLPPSKRPTISFDLSDVVKSYALCLQVKLARLAPVDSDRIPTPDPDVENILASTNDFLEGIECAILLPAPIVDAVETSVPTVDAVVTPRLTVDAVVTTSSNDEMARSSMPAESVPFTSTQMFATQKQRRRRPTRSDGRGPYILNRNSNSSTSLASSTHTNTSSASAYFEKKAQILDDENKRRNGEKERRREEFQQRKMWNKRCIEIKDEELAMRKKRRNFAKYIRNCI